MEVFQEKIVRSSDFKIYQYTFYLTNIFYHLLGLKHNSYIIFNIYKLKSRKLKLTFSIKQFKYYRTNLNLLKPFFFKKYFRTIYIKLDIIDLHALSYQNITECKSIQTTLVL